MKDTIYRKHTFKDGSVITACGVDTDGNVCGVDYINADGKIVYCLSFREDDPRSEVLEKLFEAITEM